MVGQSKGRTLLHSLQVLPQVRQILKLLQDYLNTYFIRVLSYYILSYDNRPYY